MAKCLLEKDINSHGKVREDGYSTDNFEIELIEKKGDFLCTKIIQRSSLRSDKREEDSYWSKKNSIIKNLDSSLGKFKYMAVTNILPPIKEQSPQILRDSEVVCLAVADRKERTVYAIHHSESTPSRATKERLSAAFYQT
jgi:hypothetical protein